LQLKVPSISRLPPDNWVKFLLCDVTVTPWVTETEPLLEICPILVLELNSIEAAFALTIDAQLRYLGYVAAPVESGSTANSPLLVIEKAGN